MMGGGESCAGYGRTDIETSVEVGIVADTDSRDGEIKSVPQN